MTRTVFFPIVGGAFHPALIVRLSSLPVGGICDKLLLVPFISSDLLTCLSRTISLSGNLGAGSKKDTTVFVLASPPFFHSSSP